jgi:hypothetical protein
MARSVEVIVRKVLGDQLAEIIRLQALNEALVEEVARLKAAEVPAGEQVPGAEASKS